MGLLDFRRFFKKSRSFANRDSSKMDYIPLAAGESLTFDGGCDKKNPLTCPFCDGCFLHQCHVDVLFRGKDADKGTVVSVHRGDVKTSENVRDFDGLEGRRDVIKIYYYCEECHSPPYFFEVGTQKEEWDLWGLKRFATATNRDYLIDKESGEVDPSKLADADKDEFIGKAHLWMNYLVMVIVQHDGRTFMGWDTKC